MIATIHNRHWREIFDSRWLNRHGQGSEAAYLLWIKNWNETSSWASSLNVASVARRWPEQKKRSQEQARLTDQFDLGRRKTRGEDVAFGSQNNHAYIAQRC